jgi:hypothetical protein
VATFGRWLDDYAGPDQVVAGVAQIWRAAKGSRPRLSAAEPINAWLAAQGVADESLRAAQREYREDRLGPPAGGRQATAEELAAFRAQNEPGSSPDHPAVQQASLELPPVTPLPAEQLPMVAAIVSAISSRLVRIEAIQAELLGIARRGEQWQAAQDSRIEPITRLLADLAEAEDAADQLDGQPVDEAAISSPPAAGSLWAGITAPQPDMDALAALGEPGPEEG